MGEQAPSLVDQSLFWSHNSSVGLVSRTGPKLHKIRTAQPPCTSRPEGRRVHKSVFLAIAVFLVCATCGGAAVWAADSKAVVGLRRLSEQEYRNSIADIFGKDIAVQGMFEPQIRINGLVATSTSVLSVTPAGFESFSKMADAIA